MRLAWDTFPVRAIPFGPLFILIDLLFVHIYILLMRPIKLKDQVERSRLELGALLFVVGETQNPEKKPRNKARTNTGINSLIKLGAGFEQGSHS